MRLKRPSADIWVGRKAAISMLLALMLLLIVFPSFAADKIDAEEVPETEGITTTEEIPEEAGTDAEETEMKGFVTMRAVSGNTSVTDR